MNIANFLSILRIALIPIIIYSLFNYGWEIALMFYLFASILDIVDGYVARKFNIVSDTGALLDSVGDKLVSISIIVSFLFKFNMPFMYLIMLLFRDITIAISVGIVKIFVRSKKRITFMAKRSGKKVTVLQFLSVVAILIDFLYTKYLIYATFLVSIWCLADYWYEWKKKVSIKDINIKDIKIEKLKKRKNK